jgi:hypothetical protein
MLSAAGIGQLRYGGGSYADIYNWQTNINVGACQQFGASASGCTAKNPLGFAEFLRVERHRAANRRRLHRLRGRALLPVRVLRCHRRGQPAGLAGAARAAADPVAAGVHQAGAREPRSNRGGGDRRDRGLERLDHHRATPVGAVFAAGDVLSWLAAGAQSVDWWSLNDTANTGGSCVNPGSGLFNAAGRPTAETPYYGYLLASRLAQPGAQLKSLATSDPADVLGYQSWRPDGKHAVAFINLDASSARTVTFPAVPGLAGTLDYWSYSAASQNATSSKIETGTTPALSAAGHIGLPPESVTVLETQ